MKSLLSLAILTTTLTVMFTPTPANAKWVKCASETNICKTPSGPTIVRFGTSVRGKYIEKKAVSGNITCARPEFGGDPHPYKKKSCWYWKGTLKHCANEPGICRFKRAGTVYFAASKSEVPHRRKLKKFTKGGQITCARPEFGGDPHPYKKKKCWFQEDPY
jgi:hypothetical protein